MNDDMITFNYMSNVQVIILMIFAHNSALFS